MTINELRTHFNNEFGKHGIETEWPETYEVDAETFANVCQYIFENAIHFKYKNSDLSEISVLLGKNNGIMFKGIELLVKVK